MCGRYVLDRVEDLSERFQLREIMMPLRATFNAAPTQQLPVIIIEPNGERRIVAMRWGLLPRWRPNGNQRAPEPINARAETVLEKRMFRSLVASRRCLVPASGFYEWQQRDGTKQPYFIRPTDQDVFAFAGLWDELPGDDDQPIRSFTIITTEPNELLATMHHRMAAMLPAVSEAEWLDPETTDHGVIERLVHPYPTDAMTAHPVGRAVNNTRNNTADLIEPVNESEITAPSRQAPLL